MFRKKKLDEMEQDIRNKSIIASHDFMSTVLLVWFVICMVMRKPAINWQNTFGMNNNGMMNNDVIIDIARV